MPVRSPRKPAVTLAADGERLDDARRKLLADWCRLVAGRVGGPSPDAATGVAPEAASPVEAVPVDAALAAPPRAVSRAAGPAEAVDALGLPPRMAQILRGLLAGGSEKQLARNLAISPHTVHTYVKQLHKRLDVRSRGELLARFVGLDA